MRKVLKQLPQCYQKYRDTGDTGNGSMEEKGLIPYPWTKQKDLWVFRKSATHLGTHSILIIQISFQQRFVQCPLQSNFLPSKLHVFFLFFFILADGKLPWLTHKGAEEGSNIGETSCLVQNSFSCRGRRRHMVLTHSPVRRPLPQLSSKSRTTADSLMVTYEQT